MWDFDSIYEQYSRLVYFAAYSVVKNNDEAFDISQEVFVRAYNNESKLCRMSEVQLKGWLYKVATNAALDIVRKRKREVLYDTPPFDMADGALGPEQEYISLESDTELMKAVNSLADIYRQPVILHFFSGLGYQEIADILGVTVGTIKSRMSRAKAQLKKELYEDSDDHSVGEE